MAVRERNATVQLWGGIKEPGVIRDNNVNLSLEGHEAEGMESIRNHQ